MIAVLKPGASPERTQHLIHWLEEQNLGVHVSKGEYQTVLGLIGNTAKVDMEMIQSLDIVESVTRVSDPFKAVNRKFHPEDSVIQAGPAAIGGGHFALIAGPCSVESRGADHRRGPGGEEGRGGLPPGRRLQAPHLPLLLPGPGGRRASACCWRPRRPPACPSSPSSWTSATWTSSRSVDVIQVGARNMQNFDLLKELGKTNKPILLKRGLSGTIEELAHERGVHHGRRQRERDPLRAGHPHLRVHLHPQHPGPVRGARR